MICEYAITDVSVKSFLCTVLSCCCWQKC